MTEVMKALNLFQQARNAFNRIFNRREGRVKPTEVPRVDDRLFREYQQHFERQIERHARDLASGRIDVTTWRNRMADEIDGLHTTARVVGRGGVDQMGQDDLAQITQIVNEQNAYLDNWAQQLRGQTEYDANQLARRGKLYMNAANATLAEGRVAQMGITLPAYPGDGSTQCLTNCKCRWELKAVPGGVDAYWRLGVAEHCPDCVERARKWNPLEIRFTRR